MVNSQDLRIIIYHPQREVTHDPPPANDPMSLHSNTLSCVRANQVVVLTN